jgi:hypothetical protein
MPQKIPQILGPVNYSDSFLIVTISSGKPQILNASPHNGGFIYYWESDASKIGNILPVFTSSGTVDKIRFHDQTNSGGIGFRENGVTVGNSLNPNEFKFTQTEYADWFPPDVILSSVAYKLSNINGTTGQIFTKPDIKSDTRSAIDLIILPAIWNFGCSSTDIGFVTTLSGSILNWFCTVDPKLGECKGERIVKSGWTNIDDCTIGNNYRYCKTGTMCGDDCKGPCSKKSDDCKYNKNTQKYECVFDPSNFISNTKWWESPIFFGAIALFVVLAFMVFIIGRSIAMKQRKK